MKFNKIAFLIIMIFISNSISFSDSNGIWTYPRDVQPGIFGEDESTNFNENFTFNHLVYFNNNLISNSNIGIGVNNPTQRLDVNGNEFMDRDNPSFVVNPSEVSFLNRTVSNRYFSFGSGSFYLDPKDYSRLNSLNVNLLQFNGVDINDLFVNEGQVNSITSDMVVDGTITGSDLELSYQTGSVYDSRFLN